MSVHQGSLYVGNKISLKEQQHRHFYTSQQNSTAATVSPSQKSSALIGHFINFQLLSIQQYFLLTILIIVVLLPTQSQTGTTTLMYNSASLQAVAASTTTTTSASVLKHHTSIATAAASSAFYNAPQPLATAINSNNKNKNNNNYHGLLPAAGVGAQPSGLSHTTILHNKMSSISSASSPMLFEDTLDIINQFTVPNGSYFTHLTYDRRRNVVYAGATNYIIQFNKNLSVLSQTQTGPKSDSPVCHAGGCPDDIETQETPNHNKILLVNQYGDMLIACGSIRQGACEMYNLTEFPNQPKYIEIAIAANDERSSTYAFIGPSRYRSWTRENVLYVGTTFTNVGDYRPDVPAISSRKLDDLNYAEYTIQQSTLNIDVKYRDHFLVDYVYGFNSTEYAYFVVVQKKSHLAEEAGYVTRLARVCVNDANYDSYTEITIGCMSHSNVDYNIIRDAKIQMAGIKFAQQLGLRKTDYVLIAIFSPSKEITNEPLERSAMCVYSIKEIEEVFTENIHMCFNGSIQDRNLGYISGAINDGRCPVDSNGNVFNFCTAGLKISGVSPIVSRALVDFDNESISSVTTAITGPHLLAFLGTVTGFIKKVLISGQQPGEYERIEVDRGHTILPDTMIGPKQDYLYVLSTNTITKLRIEHCAIYTNCSSCLESRDPFCGWCSLEKKCTVRSACQKDTSASRWLSLGTGQQCIDFEMIVPDKIPINQMTTVQLIIRTLPELPINAKYKCVFGNSTPVEANVTENGLTCSTPAIRSRPQIDPQHDHVLVPLSVRSSETNKDFVSRNFAYFDCSRHIMCTQCVKSFWHCKWCIYDNKCIHNNTRCQNTMTVITSDQDCPQFKHPQMPILLPNKVPKEIKLEIDNLPRPQSAHTGFLCSVNIEGAHMVLPARVESNKYIVCEKTPYSYEAITNEYEVQVVVNWNRNHYIDTVSITLYKCETLGSHREHADCSLCITRDPKYQCTWCGNSCVFNETCTHGNANDCPKPRIDSIQPLSGPIEGGTYITIEGSNLGIQEDDVRGKIRIGNLLCEVTSYEISVKIKCRTAAAPRELSAPIKIGNSEIGFTESKLQFHYIDYTIDSVWPSMGPQSGGTRLSIIGKYLNIGSRITAYLDGFQCKVNKTESTSNKLVCITDSVPTQRPIRTLTLSIDGANRTHTCVNNRHMTMAKEEQQIRFFNNNQFNSKGENPHHVLHECSIYNYTIDPRIMQIKPLKSFASGGRMVTVHGTNLDSIISPQIEVYYDDILINSTICHVINSNQIECPSPSVVKKFNDYIFTMRNDGNDPVAAAVSFNINNGDLTDHNKPHTIWKRDFSDDIDEDTTWFTTIGNSPTYSVLPQGAGSTSSLNIDNTDVAALKIRETQLSLQISFIMDSVKTVKNLNKYFQNVRSTIIYVEDPIFYPFPHAYKLYKGDTLVIEGEYLNIASDETDVNVTIGMSQCNVTSLALTQLVCTPPEQQPTATDEYGRETEKNLPLVVIHVGRSLRYVIGHLKYDLMKPLAFPHAIAGIAIGIFIIIALLIVVLIVYRRKSTQAEREYKRIQIQMDTLESTVRQECKQAFAELQTDMTDLTADLENSGIPTLDHVNYIMKVFFPGVSDHPILNNVPKCRINAPRSNYDTAMLQFEILINNKNFLLTFIETLEMQKTFNIRDKVNVASLVMIVLMNKMEYATDILKCLLLRLIEKSVLTKHPQLMLRRTESVVEKMLTNYMAICMYDYLKDYAGSNLFLLFKAIKHQVEKGLVDSCTNDARYSLSEERLLREQIDHSYVTLHIVQDDLDEKIQCKVIDYDTISQVKSKILDALFKNTPFSMRPCVDEVDLEWRNGRGGHLTLQDEDLTTKCHNDWKRLNTLAHYGVKESAIMSLIAKQNDSYNLNYNNQKVSGQQQASTNTGTSNVQQNVQHQQSSFNNCYYINNSQPHILLNGDLESGGLRMPRVYHLIKPVMEDINYLNIKNSMSVMNQQQPQHHHPHSHNHHHNHHQHQQQQHHLTTTNSPSATATSIAAQERTHKAIPEIFLTRLLATKGTIQKFVDDFFATILTVNDELPPAVKWLFDLLDDAAHHYGINDPDVVHAWKSNSLPLRFWVNFIKNPDFIFDINKTITVDACLSVIAQTFMDACSTTEHRLGKDSPSNKLLFAKDIPQYRDMVRKFYCEVSRLPLISDQEMGTAMQELSIQQNNEFDTIAALKELYIYISKYRDEILDALDLDPHCKKTHLAHKLENVGCTLDGEETSAC